MDDTFLGLSIEEWFKYHPPTTDERKIKHEVVNMLALEAAKCIGSDHPNAPADFTSLVFDLAAKIEQPELREWAASNIKITSADSNFSKMMKLQQIRMIANQSITVVDLKGGQ